MRTLMCMSILALLLSSGCDNQTADIVKAKNTLTGELQDFPLGDVPSGWVTCDNPACTFPFEDQCNYVRPEDCHLTPGCHLEVLACGGDEPVVVPMAAAKEAAPGEPTDCLVQCVADQPLACEMISDSMACSANAACQWVDGPMPMPVSDPTVTCVDQGPQGGCDLPIMVNGFCHTRALENPCESLDELTCLTNSECEWVGIEYAQQGCDLDVNGKEGCLLPVTGICRAKVELPCEFLDEKACLGRPGCELVDQPVYGCAVPAEKANAGSSGQAPQDCQMEPVTFCRTSQLICPPIPAMMPDCNGDAFPMFDDRGCITGYTCGEPIPVDGSTK
jgi:hypothetical protein